MSYLSQNGQMAAVNVNGIMVPANSFINAPDPVGGRFYAAQLNTIPLSARTFLLLNAPIPVLMAEQRGERIGRGW